MKTILVTGGAGFIGSNFVKHLYYKYPDSKILVLDALTYAGSVNNLPEGSFDSDRFEFWYGNVKNAEVVDSLVSRSNMVVHFAAESHVTRSIYDNFTFFDTDVIGTQVVANSVLNHKDTIERFIHISTSEVYGTAEADKMDEKHALNPLSPYASAKCGADRLVYSYHSTYQIPSVIVRPFNQYGPNQHLEKAIPRFITSCLMDEPLTVHGDGSAMRDWLFVEDTCKALDLILHADAKDVVGETFNLGNDYSISIHEVAKAIRELMPNSKSEIQLIGDRPGQVFRHTCNSTKARELLNWKPEVTFEMGLKKAIDFYSKNPQWWEPQKWMRKIPIVNASGKKDWH